jgi:hypothetical protein
MGNNNVVNNVLGRSQGDRLFSPRALEEFDYMESINSVAYAGFDEYGSFIIKVNGRQVWLSLEGRQTLFD